MEKRTFGDYIWRVVLFLWALTIIGPLFWICYSSLKSNAEFFLGAWNLPKAAQWSNYARAWSKLGIGSSLLNTVIVVGLSVILGLVVTTLTAFVFTRMEWKGKSIIWNTMMMALFLPGINVLVPNYVLMRSLHLTNKLYGLILFYIMTQSIIDLMILGGFMKSIPKELEESAFIDGASLLNIVKNVIVPLAMPGIVTVGIFKFVAYYNDFLNPYIFLSDANKFTIGVTMYNANLMMQYKSDWVALLSGIVLTMIPTVAAYVFFQSRIIEGATLGAVKG